MPEVSKLNDDEIDLFGLVETLWRGKWKIIITTFIAALVGVAFSLSTPNLYKVSTSIKNGNSSVFIKHVPINDFLNNKNLSDYVINAPTIFSMFIDEFNDYEIMKNVVSNDEFVRQSIKDLDEDDKQKALINYAKLFVIAPPSKNEINWMLSFEWHNDEQGKRLLNEALRLTLINVKTNLFNDIEQLATSVEKKIQRELEVLRSELNLIMQKQKISNNKRILYLVEQSAIAKELGIEANTLYANALAQKPSSEVLLNINTNEVPFYLRGFEAIDKELAVIRNRTQKEQLLMTDGYLKVMNSIISLENDLSVRQLKNSLKSVENDNPSDWVRFDLKHADSKSQKNSKLYVALSIIFGGMLGAIYVLASNIIRKRNEWLVKA
ncbi:MAG: Wzz/FepE/Etk N-terminal domain-containing protein [Paracoccaceae bacterium]